MKQLFKKLYACAMACLVFTSLGAVAFAQAEGQENGVLQEYNVTVVNAGEVFLFPESDVAILAEWHEESQYSRGTDNFYKQLLKKRQAYYPVTAEEIILAEIDYLGGDAYANSAVEASYKDGVIVVAGSQIGYDDEKTGDSSQNYDLNCETMAVPRKIVTNSTPTVRQ